MKKLIILIFLLIGGIGGYSQCQKIDIMICADLSGSVTGYESYVSDAIYNFAERFQLDKENGIQIGIVTFNTLSNKLFLLGDDKSALIRAIHTIKSTKAQATTNLVGAIDDCMEEFTIRGRSDALKIVIVISDGSFDYPEDAQDRARACKVMFNSVIFGILINGESANPTSMETLSSPGCYLSTSYENLVQELMKLSFCS